MPFERPRAGITDRYDRPAAVPVLSSSIEGTTPPCIEIGRPQALGVNQAPMLIFYITRNRAFSPDIVLEGSGSDVRSLIGRKEHDSAVFATLGSGLSLSCPSHIRSIGACMLKITLTTTRPRCANQKDSSGYPEPGIRQKSGISVSFCFQTKAWNCFLFAISFYAEQK